MSIILNIYLFIYFLLFCVIYCYLRYNIVLRLTIFASLSYTKVSVIFYLS